MAELEHKIYLRKHPQISHVEETADVKRCVSKVFKYIKTTTLNCLTVDYVMDAFIHCMTLYLLFQMLYELSKIRVLLYCIDLD